MIILAQKYKYKGGKKSKGPSQTGGGRLAALLEIPIFTPLLIPPTNEPHLVINWGLSDIPWLYNMEVINNPQAIKKAVNKLTSFKLFDNANVTIPRFTTSRMEAAEWIQQGNAVFCRKLLCASAGDGIVVARKVEDIVDAPLYSAYVKKKWEVRVHVCQGTAFHIAQKRRLTSEELEARGIDKGEIEPLIRNIANGYIFSNNLDDALSEPLATINDIAIKAIDAIGLTFGAVDIIVTEAGKPYVLEVNTAPGLEGITLEKYKTVFEELIK